MDQQLVHFLLVEDEEDHAVIIRRNLDLDRVRNSVDHVQDGAEALKYLRREPPYENSKRPDIILLDLKLPKLDGHEVLKSIKEDPLLADIPVVVMTTSDAESDRAKAYRYHANSYLVKPIDFEKFRQMVKDLSLYWGVWNVPVDR